MEMSKPSKTGVVAAWALPVAACGGVPTHEAIQRIDRCDRSGGQPRGESVRAPEGMERPARRERSREAMQ